MTHRPRPRRARSLAIVTALLSAVVLLLPVTAQAAPAPADRPPAGLAAALTAADLTVAADAVRAADVAGTAWAVDRAAGTVLVSADETVTDAEIARITRSAGPLARALTIERIPGKLTPRLQAGEAIYASSWRCTAGLNVQRGTSYYFLTAGHCTSGATTWWANSSHTTTIGPTVGSSFPGNDYGLVAYSNPVVPHPGTVICNGQVIDIDGAINPTVGMPVTFSGATSGCHSGTVLGLNQTVNYGNGEVVSGLIRTNVCGEPGDSGGLLFSGTKAVGLLSGGSGNCTSGGTSFFQPVIEILNAYGVLIY